jgi:hypothetical protein
MPPSNLPLIRGAGGAYSFDKGAERRKGGGGFIQGGGFMQIFGGVVCDTVLSVSKVEKKNDTKKNNLATESSSLRRCGPPYLRLLNLGTGVCGYEGETE